MKGPRWRPRARQRATLRGLEHGRDEKTMAALMQSCTTPAEAGTLGSIQSGSVYTPVRGHLTWGSTGADQTDWAHFVYGCPGTPRSAEMEGLFDCLIYSGSVLKDWIPETQTLEMRTETDGGPADSVLGTGVVANDGSSRRQGPGFRGGWGVYWDLGDRRN